MYPKNWLKLKDPWPRLKRSRQLSPRYGLESLVPFWAGLFITALRQEIDPPTTESVSEPVIEDLDEAKKVEEHAAKIEVAPVVSSSNVEVCTT